MFASVVDMGDGTYWLSIPIDEGETMVNIGAGMESKVLVESICGRINTHVNRLLADARTDVRAISEHIPDEVREIARTMKQYLIRVPEENKP